MIKKTWWSVELLPNNLLRNKLPPAHGEVILPPAHGEVILPPVHGEVILPPAHGEVFLPPVYSEVILPPADGEVILPEYYHKILSELVIVVLHQVNNVSAIYQEQVTF
jgi:hypothetical protein